MRTRLTVCVGTGGPRGHEGGLQGLEQGGAEERGPTETEERRQTERITEESETQDHLQSQRNTKKPQPPSSAQPGS
ncbi:hypothetical protein INR49_012506 [Caranx melampygus]|nr:hypothetical protein INR49_012506 [Caranx melampygus]